MTNNEFPFRAFAMEYGTFLGIAWTIVFFIYVIAFRTGNSMFLFCASWGILALAVMPFIFAWRIKQLQPKGTSLGILRGMGFSLNLFMFACLFSGACEFVYFRFFDQGQMLEGCTTMLLTPDISEQYKQMGMTDSYNQIMEVFKELKKLSAFEKTEALFNSNFFVSMILFIPVSFIASLQSTAKINRSANVDALSNNKNTQE
ncbi:MAG: DUF4199 domain-containing protein [Bacteroidaceae bacterium]|nr:DUF4199 domain-containing protein [Bacteroidaceae bacterium]